MMEKRKAVPTASSFSLPPDQCAGTVDHLMNNTGKKLPVTLPVVQHRVYPELLFTLSTIKVARKELTVDFRH